MSKEPQSKRYDKIIRTGIQVLSKLSSTTSAMFTFGYIDHLGRNHRHRWDCYAPFGDKKWLKRPIAIWAVFHHPKQDKIMELKTRTYLEWLISKEISPWRSMLPIKYNKQFWNVDFIYDHGLLISNLDTPANLLVNFLIATRLPYEYVSKLDRWWDLVGQGVHPSIAYVYVHLFDFFGREKNFKIKPWNDGHVAIDGLDINQDNFDRFVLGKPYKENFIHPFKIVGGYLPCNIVWRNESKVLIYYKLLLQTLQKGEIESSSRFKQENLSG